MRYVSTRGGAPAVSLRAALLNGLAPDGGLYVPETIPARAAADGGLAGSLGEVGARMLAPFVDRDIAPGDLRGIVDAALDFPIPLVEIEPGVQVLELFHGPTLAFKDVAARVMARLFGLLREPGRPLTVLVATSGDTGGAVAHAFAGVPGTRLIVLYPDGRVSPTQEAQLTTFNGAGTNVAAYAVDGTFDDCQRLVKQAFGDAGLRRDAGLTSANSINIGRLLPQMIYYAHAVGQLERRPAAVSPHAATFVVPSGNFGNLTAGVMAKRAGIPIARFVAATNANDVVPTYLRTGRFEARPSISTIANAMDVGDPSNFERLQWLFGGDAGAMRAAIAGSAHTEDEIRGAIGRVYDRCGYLLDPHSAIGYLAAKAQAGEVGQVQSSVFLATAHPAKFREIVEPIVGRPVDVPPALAAALADRRPRLRLEPTLTALRDRIVA